MAETRPVAKLPPLTWVSGFESGDVDIDREHCELLVDINILSNLLAETGRWPEIVAKSRELRDKCFAHFRDEIKKLTAARYEKVAAHAAEHRHIQEQLDDIVEHISSVTRPSPAELEATLFLRSMLIHHFFLHDLAYKSHLASRQRRG